MLVVGPDPADRVTRFETRRGDPGFAQVLERGEADGTAADDGGGDGAAVVCGGGSGSGSGRVLWLVGLADGRGFWRDGSLGLRRGFPVRVVGALRRDSGGLGFVLWTFRRSDCSDGSSWGFHLLELGFALPCHVRSMLGGVAVVEWVVGGAIGFLRLYMRLGVKEAEGVADRDSREGSR